jgi:hypothetical protein
MPRYTIDGGVHEFKVEDRLTSHNTSDEGGACFCHSLNTRKKIDRITQATNAHKNHVRSHERSILAIRAVLPGTPIALMVKNKEQNRRIMGSRTKTLPQVLDSCLNLGILQGSLTPRWTG